MIKEFKTYKTISFSLANARTDEKYDITGDFIIVETLDGSATIKLDRKSNDSIDLEKFSQVNTDFERFYLTNTAQSGKTLKLMIGGAASFKAIQSSPRSEAHIRRDVQEATPIENVNVAAGGMVTHYRWDVDGYQFLAFMIDTTIDGGNFTIYPQCSLDNVNWFDPKTQADVDKVYNATDEKICRGFVLASRYFRLVCYNGGGSAARITARLISRY